MQSFPKIVFWSITLTFAYVALLSVGSMNLYTWWGGAIELPTGGVVAATFALGVISGITIAAGYRRHKRGKIDKPL